MTVHRGPAGHAAARHAAQHAGGLVQVQQACVRQGHLLWCALLQVVTNSASSSQGHCNPFVHSACCRASVTWSPVQTSNYLWHAWGSSNTSLKLASNALIHWTCLGSCSVTPTDTCRQVPLQVPDAQRLLKDACHVAAVADQETHNNWACAAQEQYPKGADNEYSHLRVASFSDEVSTLPPEELQVSAFEGMA